MDSDDDLREQDEAETKDNESSCTEVSNDEERESTESTKDNESEISEDDEN